MQHVLGDYLRELQRLRPRALILGCTHYPLLREAIAKLMGPEVPLVESGRSVAEEVQRRRRAAGTENRRTAGGLLRCFTTDNPGDPPVPERTLRRAEDRRRDLRGDRRTQRASSGGAMNDMARRHAAFLAIGLMVLIVLAGAFGCDGTLQQVVTSAATSRPAAVADPNDPDKRRASIVEWSGKSWGLKEPYTAYYAAALRKDNDALVRSAAAGALGQTHDAKYVSNLAAAMEDASPQVRWDVAQALDELPGKAAMGPLQKHATEDESADVRASRAGPCDTTAATRSARHC